MLSFKNIFCALFIFGVFILGFSGCKKNVPTQLTPSPKRELRGVWIATVDNIDWPRRGDTNSVSQQRDFVRILDEHQRSHINALFVQVRDACDAYYAKSNEPWSEWLTGKQGRAPEPYYDPMAFMIEEAHQRGMEFHAWLNLNRAVFKTAKSIAPDHISNRRPDWILTYDGQKLLNFGIPEVRDYITEVVLNIIHNYDVDGIHFDDYFYPYKVKDQVLQDAATFKQYPNGFKDIEAWRRHNTDLLIKQIADAIRAEKPFVKFGISPFGVWKNRSAKDPDGSATQAGQTSYHDLYADTRKWVQQGWIDYMAPQVYFPFGHKLVRYDSLVSWWTRHSYGKHLYIGQGAYRIASTREEIWKSLSEMPNQLRFNHQHSSIQGSIFFSSKSVTQNLGGFQDSLRYNFYRNIALVPAMPWKDDKAPEAPQQLRYQAKNKQAELSWLAPKGEAPTYYAIYRFEESARANTENPDYLLAVTRRLDFVDGSAEVGKTYRYVVTALDRLHNESKPQQVRGQLE